MPDPLGTLLTAEGEDATFSYDSVINGAEANVFLTSTRWRSPTAAWLTVDWLAGFRYVGVEEDASLLIDHVPAELRPARWSNGSATSFVGDLNLSLVYRLTDTWGVRAGYNLLWIEGLALAPDQFDFSVDANAGRRLDSGGGMFLHGANLGLEAHW